VGPPMYTQKNKLLNPATWLQILLDGRLNTMKTP